MMQNVQKGVKSAEILSQLGIQKASIYYVIWSH